MQINFLSNGGVNQKESEGHHCKITALLPCGAVPVNQWTNVYNEPTLNYFCHLLTVQEIEISVSTKERGSSASLFTRLVYIYIYIVRTSPEDSKKNIPSTSHTWSNSIKIVFMWGSAEPSTLWWASEGIHDAFQEFWPKSFCAPPANNAELWVVAREKISEIRSGRYTRLLSSFNTLVRHESCGKCGSHVLQIQSVAHVRAVCTIHVVRSTSTGSSVPLASSRAARFSTGASLFAFVCYRHRERFEGSSTRSYMKPFCCFII